MRRPERLVRPCSTDLTWGNEDRFANDRRERLFGDLSNSPTCCVYGTRNHWGLKRLSGGEKQQYWGHNAHIRMAEFAQNCGLPKLSGREPFRRRLRNVAHDFVEGAMMRTRRLEGAHAQ